MIVTITVNVTIANVTRWISRNPVAVLTTLYSVLAAVAAIVVELNLLPDHVTGYLTAAVAVLAAILGALTHTKVTPLVNPKNNDGVPLVPVRRGGLIK
jgi:hypothetical protein